MTFSFSHSSKAAISLWSMAPRLYTVDWKSFLPRYLRKGYNIYTKFSLPLFLKKVPKFSWKTSFGLVGALGFLVPVHRCGVVCAVPPREEEQERNRFGFRLMLNKQSAP